LFIRALSRVFTRLSARDVEIGFPSRHRLLAATAVSAFCILGAGRAVHAATLTTVATFNGTNGALAEAGLTADATGDLFGKLGKVGRPAAARQSR
jgi:hypothetical protein